jgi:hypothetical protein
MLIAVFLQEKRHVTATAPFIHIEVRCWHYPSRSGDLLLILLVANLPELLFVNSKRDSLLRGG